MSSLNRIVLIGEVESTPDIKATNSGDSYANFRLKVDRPSRQDGLVAQPDTIDIVAWRQTAEKAGSLSIGNFVVVEGRIITRNFDDENGVRKYVTEVEARELQAMPSNAAAASPAAPADAFYEETQSAPIENFDFNEPAKPAEATEISAELEEDIPF